MAQTDLKILRRSTLLDPLSDEDLLAGLKSRNFRIVSFRKNSIIHFEGETCGKLEIILAGQVAVDRIDESGHLTIISEFRSDDILGGNLLFSRRPAYPLTISARQVTEILEIDREALFALLSRNEWFLRSYLAYVSDHASILGDRIRQDAYRTIREHVLDYLEHECKRQASRHIRLTLSKKGLAEQIGVQRTSLSRELAKMRDDGLIAFDAETITLL